MAHDPLGESSQAVYHRVVTNSRETGLTEPRRRDREATTHRVIAAAARILAEEGALALGVNALAKAADCDKQLIYRYFGGLDGVLAALGEAVAERLSAALARAAPAPARNWSDFAVMLARGLLSAYRADPALGRIRAAEFAGPPGALAAFAEARGRVIAAWVASVRPPVPPPPGCDVAALLALFTGAIEGAVLSAAATGAMSGLPLAGEADWARLETALCGAVASAFAAPPP